MFKKIFEPVRIGKLDLKNRLVFPAITANYGTEEGAITEVAKAFYVERAKGGVGLIITGSFAIDPRGHVLPYQFTLYDRKNYKGMKELAQLIQRHGSKVAFQLHHAGSRAAPKVSGTQPITSFPIAHPIHHERPKFVSCRPRALTLREIHEMIKRYAWAAKIGEDLGFDAVEIHCAHAHLIDQFLSPLLNQRRDEYGGDLIARARFAQEVIAEVRKAVGPDYPILCKMNASEYVEGGTTLEDARVIARLLEEAGADALQVSVGQSSQVSPTPSSVFPQGCFIPLAAGIKELVSIPVIAVARIHHLEMAEKILQQGKADLVAMGRSLIADPDLPRKAMEGRIKEVRPCIVCIQGCITRILSSLPMRCSVNPTVGREGTFLTKKAKSPKKVLIAGGGPAGLEAARVAKSRGHKVVLFEKNDSLGGWLNIASLIPHKEEFKDLIEFYKHEMKTLGVEVQLGSEVNVETIKKNVPDVVIVATGSIPFVPQIRGMDKKHVLSVPEVLMGRKEVGKRVVILGGGRIGCEAAEFLALRGKQVTLVEEGEEVGSDISPRTRMFMLPRLNQQGVEMMKKSMVLEMDSTGILISRPGKVEKIDTDSVIVALGFVPQSSLIEALEPIVPKLKGFFIIGDCAEPRTVLDAVYDGWRVGRMI